MRPLSRALVLLAAASATLAAAQTTPTSVIDRVSQIDANDRETGAGKGVIDTRISRLRIYWNRDVLNEKLSMFGPGANVSAQLQRAADVADITRKGAAAAANLAAAARDAVGLTPAAYRAALDPVVNGLAAALLIVQGDADLKRRLQDAFSRGANDPSVAAGPAAQANAAAAVFSELARIAQEEAGKVAEALKASGSRLTVVATTSREQDDTRRRDVPFLSALTAGDQAALQKIRDYAATFGGTPSDLVKAEVSQARDAAKKTLNEAKAALDAQAATLSTKWGALLTRYQTASPAGMDLASLKTAVEALQATIKAAADSFKADADSIRTGDPKTQSDALARLQEASNALANAKATLGGLGALSARIDAVTSAIVALPAAIDQTVAMLATDLKAFVGEIKTSAATLATDLDTIAKGSVSTLYDALGIGRSLQQIAQTVTPADPANASVDVDMTKANDQPLTLLAGDEIVLTIKAGDGTPASEESIGQRRLAAYPNRWTSDRIIPIAFTERRSRDASGKLHKGYSFSPTYMDVFKRYSTNRTAESNRWLTPGLGLAVTALDQNGDNSYEIGLGAGLTLLDDRLIAGIGFNTQRNQSYLFFGIRLRLGDLGIRG